MPVLGAGRKKVVIAELCGGEGRLAAKVLTRFGSRIARYQLLESNATLASLARTRCAAVCCLLSVICCLLYAGVQRDPREFCSCQVRRVGVMWSVLLAHKRRLWL